MHLKTRNVNTAFKDLLEVFTKQSEDHWPEILRRPSRNGNALMIDEPVLVTYARPRERVLFNPARDANPFFHLYEALWMLSGRNDVASVAYYAKQMKEYSDDGVSLNGAYGYRWRHANPGCYDFTTGQDEDEDQLDLLVKHLKAYPSSRRAVLQMWNVENDLLQIGPWPNALASKDVCCNLSVMFSISFCEDCEATGFHRYKDNPDGSPQYSDSAACHSCGGWPRYLNMTVTNRSNDLIWGMLGANYVHFTFLQEYMAARLGAQVGVYNHFTNNLHVYDWNWEPAKWLHKAHIHDYGYHIGAGASPETKAVGCKSLNTPKLVAKPEIFEREVKVIVANFDGGPICGLGNYEEPFLDKVARPMFTAFRFYKEGDLDAAIKEVRQVVADDWRYAAENWLNKRKEKRNGSE